MDLSKDIVKCYQVVKSKYILYERHFTFCASFYDQGKKEMRNCDFNRVQNELTGNIFSHVKETCLQLDSFFQIYIENFQYVGAPLQDYIYQKIVVLVLVVFPSPGPLPGNCSPRPLSYGLDRYDFDYLYKKHRGGSIRATILP